MVTTYIQGITVEQMHCCSCHFAFTAPEYFFSRLRKSGESFYCPQCGVTQGWDPGESEASKLKKQLANMGERLERVNACCESLRRSKRGYLGQLGRMKKRLAEAKPPAPVEQEA